jgi:hypothetical protein
MSVHYASITPQHLAALSLRRAADALEQSASDPTTWFFVILDLHRALYCALVAALSGSAEIGAYPDKAKADWLAYFEATRTDPEAKMPDGYVAPFGELLSRAEKGTTDMWGAPLTLTPEQRADILKLNKFRNDLEHVKPRTWWLKVGGLPRLCANAAAACGALLESFAHHLEEEEIEQVKAALSKFERLGIEHPSSPPSTWTKKIS